MTTELSFIEALIDKEIAAMVADARRADEPIVPTRCVSRLLVSYTGCGFSEADLYKKVVKAADQAGVPYD